MRSSGKKAALVTGAARGIGRAIALELAAQGYGVVVNYAGSETMARATVAAIVAAGGDAAAIRADVRSASDLEQLFAATLQRFGRLDVLVNNAGVAASAMVGQIDAAGLDSVFDVNIKAVILATQCAVTAFGTRGGSIVNVSSALVAQPVASQAVYAASKAAVEAFTRVAAQELGPRRIRVNAVAPGPTDTDMLPAVEEVRGFLASRAALGRLGQPADIACAVAFLAGDAAGWVTGQILGVDGGVRV